MSKTFERTYEVDTEGGPLAPLTSKQKAGLTRRLRAEAKKEGVADLGDTAVVSTAGDIGGVLSVTVRATAGEQPTETDDDAEVDEAENLVADLDAPAEA